MRSFRQGSRAFTVIEVMLVAVLMSFLALLISGAWTGLGRTTADVAARSRVAREANMAAASLARDFSGSLPGQPGGGREQGRLVGRMIAAGPELRLCFDGDGDGLADWASPDTVVAYRIDTELTYGQSWKRLVRSDSGSLSEFTVAANVDQMQLTDQGDAVKIDLTFTYRDITRTYTFLARDP